MSLPIMPTDQDDRMVNVAARAVVPMLVAAAVTALALVAVRADALDAPGDDARGAPPPTPYSDMHARVQAEPGEPEPQPPTF